MHPAVYIVGTAISTTILLVAIWNYRRKSGTDVRGSYTVSSSIDCDDKFVSSVTLENQKDRALTIFGIYLQVGHPYYIELEDLEGSPLILRPYETYYKEYGPLEFYAVGMKKVDFNKLLDDRKVRKKLVLSTSQGRYVVRKFLNRWNPIIEFFRNSYAATARPIPSSYKDRALGSNVQYVVELSSKEGKEEVIPIHRRDHEFQKFRSFRLTPESLASKEALEEFLHVMRDEGKLSSVNITVLDVDAWREKSNADYEEPKIVLNDVNLLIFHVFGRLHSIYSDWQLKRRNRAARKNSEGT